MRSIAKHSNFTDVVSKGGCANESTITRTWTAIDECDNTSSCVQVITVEDNTSPVITCPSDVTIECTESTDPANTGFATGDDNCDPSPTVTFTDVVTMGACANESTITRTWTAIDECDNTSSCVQVITVEDNTSPVITCPSDVTIECTESTDPANTGFATGDDNCDLRRQ